MSAAELVMVGVLGLLFAYIGLVYWGLGSLTAEEAERKRRGGDAR